MQDQISRFRHDLRGALNVIRLHVELLKLPLEPGELGTIVNAIENSVIEIDGMVTTLSAKPSVASFGGVGISDMRMRPAQMMSVNLDIAHRAPTRPGD